LKETLARLLESTAENLVLVEANAGAEQDVSTGAVIATPEGAPHLDHGQHREFREQENGDLPGGVEPRMDTPARHLLRRGPECGGYGCNDDRGRSEARSDERRCTIRHQVVPFPCRDRDKTRLRSDVMRTAIGGMVLLLAACSGSEGSEPTGSGGEATGGAAVTAGKASAGTAGEPVDSGGSGGSPVVPVGDGGSGGDVSPTEGCDLAHRTGTYVQSFTERAGGNCGPLPDQVGVIEDALALPVGCTLDKPDKASADQCDLTRAFTCPLDGAPGTVSTVAFTSESDGGATLAGLFTLRIYDGDGALVCLGTYDLVATRQ
jgi:hypothetical protein